MINKLKTYKVNLLNLTCHAFGLGMSFTLLTRGKFFALSNPSDGRAHFFTAQAFSILNGHFDVPPIFLRGLNGECFVYSGKCLGYFGITPTLIRFPLLPFINQNQFGINPFFPITLAFLLYLFFALKIYRIFELRKNDFNSYRKAMFILTIYGSPIMYLITNPYVYYETILWAVALSFATFYFGLKYNLTCSAKYLVLSIIFCLLTFHARIVEGIGVLIYLFWIIFSFYRKGNISFKNLALAISALIAICTSYLVLNIIKFGELQPSIIKHHLGVRSNEYRLNFYEAVGTFRLTRIPKLLFAYIWPDFRNWSTGYAFQPNNYNINLFGIHIPLYSVEQSEYFSPITSSFLLTTCTAIIGAIYLFNSQNRIYIPILVSTGISILFLCSFIGATQRYVSELWIFFLILSIVGLMKLDFNRKGIVIVAFLLMILQFWQSLELSLNFWLYWNDIPVDFYTMQSYFSNYIGFL